jgi:hypothetical protein
MRRYTTSFIAQKKAIISTIHNNANFGGVGAGGVLGVGLIISSSFEKEKTHKGRLLQQAGAVEPSKQGIIYNHQASTAQHRTAPANKHPRPKARVKFRVKPQAVGITGIRARVRLIVEAWAQFH